MASNRTVIRSNFKLVPGAVEEGIKEAAEKWLRVNEDSAKAALTQKESQRGYALNTIYEEIHGEMLGDTDARVVSPTWYSRFFEYGTRYIEPMPFMRPGKTKADKAFKDAVGGSVTRAVYRRARVR